MGLERGGGTQERDGGRKERGKAGGRTPQILEHWPVDVEAGFEVASIEESTRKKRALRGQRAKETRGYVMASRGRDSRHHTVRPYARPRPVHDAHSPHQPLHLPTLRRQNVCLPNLLRLVCLPLLLQPRRERVSLDLPRCCFFGGEEDATEDVEEDGVVRSRGKGPLDDL